MADIQVEVAVVVQVGEGGRGRPVAVPSQAGRDRHVLERAVAPVAIQGVRPPSGDEQIGMAVVVVVADRHAVAVSLGHLRQARGSGHILERPIAAISEQAVAKAPTGPIRPGWEGTTLEHIDVEPAVAVEIDQADPAAHVFG